jgi:hypothetical protein
VLFRSCKVLIYGIELATVYLGGSILHEWLTRRK